MWDEGARSGGMSDEKSKEQVARSKGRREKMEQGAMWK
jgi:hypothetical protein